MPEAEQKNPASGQASGVEIQNQERNQIMADDTTTEVAFAAKGAGPEDDPSWEVSVEQVEGEWVLYEVFTNAAPDGTVDVDAMGDFLRAHSEGQAALHAVLQPIESDPDGYSQEKRPFRCRTRGCIDYGLVHMENHPDDVYHHARRERGEGWEVEVNLYQEEGRWTVYGGYGDTSMPADNEEATRFLHAVQRCEAYARQLNGDTGQATTPAKRRTGGAARG